MEAGFKKEIREVSFDSKATGTCRHETNRIIECTLASHRFEGRNIV